MLCYHRMHSTAPGSMRCSNAQVPRPAAGWSWPCRQPCCHAPVRHGVLAAAAVHGAGQSAAADAADGMQLPSTVSVSTGDEQPWFWTPPPAGSTPPPAFDDAGREPPPEQVFLRQWSSQSAIADPRARSLLLLRDPEQPSPSMLTRLIQQATSWRQLLNLLRQYEHAMGPIHVTALLAAAAGYATTLQKATGGASSAAVKQQSQHVQQQQQQQQELHVEEHGRLKQQQQEEEEAHQQQDNATSRHAAESAATATAAGESNLTRRKKQALLQAQHAQELLTGLRSLAMRSSEDLDAQGLSLVLRALVQLRLEDREVMEELLGCAALRAAEFDGQNVAVLLGALAQAGYRPPDAWLQHFLADLPSRLHLFSDQGVANTLWALGKLRSRPSQQCLEALLGHMQLGLGQYSAQHLAMSAWGLAKLGARPTETWLETFLDACNSRFGSCTAHELAYIAWALPHLGATPNPPWLQAFSQHCQQHVAAMDARGLSCTLFGLARLQQQRRRAAGAQQAVQQQHQHQQQQQPNQGGAPEQDWQAAVAAQQALLCTVMSQAMPQLLSWQPNQIADLALSAAELGAQCEPYTKTSWAAVLGGALTEQQLAGMPSRRRSHFEAALRQLGCSEGGDMGTATG